MTDAAPDSAAQLREFLASHDARCPGCGYNLRSLTTGLCPECGAAPDLAFLRRWTLPGWSARKAHAFAAWGYGVAVTSLALKAFVWWFVFAVPPVVPGFMLLIAAGLYWGCGRLSALEALPPPDRKTEALTSLVLAAVSLLCII